MATCTASGCDREPIEGGEVCRQHGGSAPQVVKAAERSVLSRDLSSFIEPIGSDDDEYNPATGLQAEYARTQGRLRWLREALASLDSAEDLVWGVSKEERITAAEFPGTNTTYESRVNVLLDLEQRERKHLLDLEKLLSSNAFREAELALQERLLDHVHGRLTRAAESLGLDLADPEVRGALSEALHPGD